MNRQRMGKILIMISLVFFTGACLMLLNNKEKEEFVQKNNKLNEEQTIDILKNVQKYLGESLELKPNSFTQESVVKFAASYMTIDDKYNSYVEFADNNPVLIVDKEKLSQVIEYIFGTYIIDYENLGYKIEKNKIHIPVNPQGGDAQIYKYRNTEYVEEDNTYIAYIDCLEASKDISHSLSQSSQIDYSEEYVNFTMVFKYKLDGERKVLIAFKTI